MSKKRRRRSQTSSAGSKKTAAMREKEVITTAGTDLTVTHRDEKKLKSPESAAHELYAHLYEVSKLTAVPFGDLLDFIEERQADIDDEYDDVSWSTEDDDIDAPPYVNYVPGSLAWNAYYDRADEETRKQMDLYRKVQEQKARKNATAKPLGYGGEAFTNGAVQATTQVKEPTAWTAERPACITECGAVGTPVITFSRKAWAKVQALMNRYTHLEWLAYLVGRKEEDDLAWWIEDLRIPEQLVQPSHVKVTDKAPDFEGVVGVCHSHNTMDAFFSGEDKDYINSNHPLSIVFSKKAGRDIEYKVMARSKVPCGETLVREGGVIHLEEDHEAEAWLKEVESSIVEEKLGYSYASTYSGRSSAYTTGYTNGSTKDSEPWWKKDYSTDRAASAASSK